MALSAGSGGERIRVYIRVGSSESAEVTEVCFVRHSSCVSR